MYINLDQKLISSVDDKPSLGLYNGKMGICLYFYYLGRLNNNKSYSQIASRLIDEIFNELREIKTIEMQSGLSGIGLAVNYLIEGNYVEGDINRILSDIDDQILRRLLYEKYYEETDLPEIIQVLYYLYIRLLKQKKNSISEDIHQEAIIYTINNMYSKIDSSFFHEEPFVYNNSQFYLPQFLFVLGKIYSVNFYNDRITKIIEEMAPYILSFIPTLHANRLHLLWGVDLISQRIGTDAWSNHSNLLKQEINVNIILDQELNDRNIYFMDGLTGIYCLLMSLQKYFDNKRITSYIQKISDNINKSQAWNLLQSDKNYFDNHRGLAYGYCGVSILCNLLKKYQHENRP